MKAVRGYIVGIMFGITLLVLPARVLYRYVNTIHTTACVFDPLFSESLCAEMRVYMQSYKNKSRFCLGQELRRDFPLIQSVSVQQSKPHCYCCTIQASKPLFSLSEQTVLLENGVIADKKNFMPESVATLFPLAIEHQKGSMAPAQLTAWLHTVPDEVIQQYCITWSDRTTIMVRSMQQPKLQIIGDYKTVFNKQMLSYCLLIACNGEGTVDVRFKDQIVFHKGGS